MVIIPTEKRFDWRYAPVMLFTIVTINILVFFLYQSNDDAKFGMAFEHYLSQNLLQNEWPAYQQYLTNQEEPELLKSLQHDFKEDNPATIIATIISDQAFYTYLQDDSDVLVFNPYNYTDTWENWRTARQQVNQYFRSISSFSLGLTPNQLSLLTLLSSQFLHGSTMHLFGNMFFLVLCGFAVEAAIGSALFLGLYLASGIVGGLLFAVLDLSSDVPLVGASGAISGVMAMYLAIFRLKKIEFFYWIFIFAGYFRAPSLLVLPIYIGKEIIDFYTNEGSNVAFMAHAGGFIGGGALVGLVYWKKPELINTDYIEEDQAIDPQRESLGNIYDLIEKYQYPKATQAIDHHIAQFGHTAELALLNYYVAIPQGSTQVLQSLSQLITLKPTAENQQNRWAQAWADNPDLHNSFPAQDQLKLAINFATTEHIPEAEAIFEKFYASHQQASQLGILARKLALFFERQGNQQKKAHYEAIAEQYLTGVA